MRVLLSFLAVLVAVAATSAQESKKSKVRKTVPAAPIISKPAAVQDEGDATTPAGKVAAVKAKYQKEYNAWLASYRKASKAERTEILGKRPRPAKYIPDMWKVVDAHAKDPAAADGLVWIARNGAGEGRNKAFDRLLADHAQSEKLGDLCLTLERSSEPSSIDVLRKIMKLTPHADVKGRACYSLAKALKRQGETAAKIQGSEDEAQRYKRFLDKAAFSHLAKADAAKLQADAVRILEEVVENCGQVPHPYRKGKSLADAAAADLFEMNNLAIGKTAPDIDGEDIDGVAFKLSDYRGKVVMLDFWGDW